MADFGGMGMGALAQGIGNTTNGLIWEPIRNRQQMRISNKTHARDVNSTKELMALQQKMQFDMWQKTGIGGQFKEALKAGASPGLLFNSGGVSGQTGGGAPSAGGGESFSGANRNQGMGQLGIQEMLVAAQVANINADTKLKEADATKTAGVDTELAQATTVNVVQDTKNKVAAEQQTKTNTAISEMVSGIKGASEAEIVEVAKANMAKSLLEFQELGNEVYISNNVKDATIKKIQAEAVGAVLQNQATQLGMQLTAAQIEKVKEETWQMTVAARQRGTQIDQELMRIKLTAILGEEGLRIAKNKIAIDALSGVVQMGMGKMPTTNTTTSESWDAEGNPTGERRTQSRTTR